MPSWRRRWPKPLRTGRSFGPCTTCSLRTSKRWSWRTCSATQRGQASIHPGPRLPCCHVGMWSASGKT
jgi:hypothetical protein